MAQARKHRLVARAPRKPSLLCSGGFPGRAAPCWTTTAAGGQEGIMRTAPCALWRESRQRPGSPRVI